MRDRVYRTEAIVLRRSDFNEADRLVTLATPAGKRRVVAKSARKTSSRLAGHIEQFTHATLLLAIGRNLDIITQSQTITGFGNLRADLARLGYAYYVAELYETCAQEYEESPQLFRLLVQTLSALDMTRNPDLVTRMYELRLLHTLGYRPHLQYCAVCQELLDEQTERFSPALGGALCPRDAAADRNAVPLSRNGFKLLRYLQRESFAAIEAMQISPGVRSEAESLLRTYLHTVLERSLQSATFLAYVTRGQ